MGNCLKNLWLKGEEKIYISENLAKKLLLLQLETYGETPLTLASP